MSQLIETAPTETAAPAGAAASELVHLVEHAGVVEIWNGQTRIASTTRAIELHEADVPVRLYVPRDDVDLDLLRPLDTTSFCPFKGVASDYWALASDADDAPVAWSYPQPINAFAPIAGHVAFYDRADLRISA